MVHRPNTVTDDRLATEPTPFGPASPRRRLYDRASAHVNRLAVTDAVAWVRGHGLLSLSEWPGLPSALRAPLERLRERTLATNTALLWHFQDVVDALGDIPVCPLKGIHLLATIYRDERGARPLWDIDVLVPEELIDAAVERLADRLGYREPTSSRRIGDIHYHRCLWDGRHQLEVHTRLGPCFGRSGDWSSVTPVPGRLHDRDLWCLDDATLMVHLLAHFIHHGPFDRLKWVEDLLRLSETGAGGADGAEVMARAGSLGVGPTVWAAISVLHKAFDDEVLTGLPAVGRLERLQVALAEVLLWRDRHLIEGERISAPRLKRNLRALLLAGSPQGALETAHRKVVEVWRRRAGAHERRRSPR